MACKIDSWHWQTMDLVNSGREAEKSTLSSSEVMNLVVTKQPIHVKIIILLWYLRSIRIVKLEVKHVKSPPKPFKHDFKKAEHEPAGLKINLILFLRTYWVLPRHLMSKLGMFTLKIR